MYDLTVREGLVSGPAVTSQQLIDTVRSPLSADRRQAIEEVIDAEAKLVASKVVAGRKAGLNQAQQEEKLAEQRKTQATERRMQAEQDYKRVADETPSLTHVVLFSVAAAACMGAEFTLTLATLPWLLNLARYSVAGIAVSLAPTAAVVAFDVVVSRLFEEPWRERKVWANWFRYSAWAAMAVFLVSLGAANLAMILDLADAREVASRVMRTLAENTTAAPEMNDLLVNQAIRWVSVLAMVDGAVMLLLALFEGKDWLRYRRLRREAHKAREGAENATRHHADASVQLHAAAAAYERADEDGKAAGDSHRQAQRYRLATAAELPPAKRASEITDQLLRELQTNAANAT